MPEHVHVLLLPQRDEAIETIRKSLKQSVARRAIAHLRRTNPHWLEKICEKQPSGRKRYHFWQPGGGDDRNLWREDAVWTAIEYIHMNPVRRGLCEHPED